VAYALLTVVGVGRAVSADREGRYEIGVLSAGTVIIRVAAIGYAARVDSVSVPIGGAATLDFTLQQLAVDLDAMVVTATGDRRAVEVPNAIATIDVERVATEVAPINLASVIQGRAPGVQVFSASGSAGTGTKILIRGSSSMSLNNEPILIVDGIRVDNRPAVGPDIGVGTFPFSGGQGISRFNDFDPDQVESIDIVKGPSAAALYGTDAANGVIVVTTKRGRAGPTVFNFYSELGAVSDRGGYRNNYRGIAADGSTCRIASVAAGTCEQAGLEYANPLVSPTTSPFRTAGRYQIGGSAAGGSRDVQYFLSAEYEKENGVYTLPGRTRDSILGQRPPGYEIPDFVLDPNRLGRASLRANVNARLSHSLSVQLSTAYADGDIHLPVNDRRGSGLLFNGSLNSDSTVRGGWGIAAPEEIFWVDLKQSIQRFTQSASLSVVPVAWLSLRLLGGLDYSGASNVFFQPTGAGPDVLTWKDNGLRLSDKVTSWVSTLDARGSAQLPLNERITSRSSLGFQYYRTYREFLSTRGEGFPPGAGSNASATSQSIDEAFVESRTLGTYLEEQIGYDNRLFVTGALRGDDNSAFGSNFDFTIYPKLGASYVLVDRSLGMLSNVRLRAAWGASGVQPGPNDAVRYLSGIPLATDGVDLPGVVIQNPGNPDLRPERSEEWEAGIDAGALAGRLGFTFTYYRRTTKDALVSRALPPSLGLTATRLENVGRTLNYGIEVGVNGAVPLSRFVRWSFNVAGSTNTNRILALGEGVAPIIGEGYAHKEGYPLGGYWDYAYTYEDSDGNGLISPDEVTVSDTTVFLGYPRPRYELAIFNGVEIGSWLRISGLLDYRGGHVHWNGTEYYRCVTMRVCQELNDVATPLAGQARATAAALTPRQTIAGYVEPAWFIKLRELSFTFFAPPHIARMMRADRASLTITGRNLLTITDYTGLDPEIEAGGAESFINPELFTQPPVRYWTARLQLTF